MTHRARRSRARSGHRTATGPVTPTRSHERWGRVETERTALGEALVVRRRTRVRFPPPPLRGSWRNAGIQLAKSRGHREQRWPRLRRVWVVFARTGSTTGTPVLDESFPGGLRGLSRVTQVWLAGEPRDAVGVRQTAAEPLRCQMRPVSWAHMASST